MAEWSKNKVDPSSLNNGQEYTKNDNVSLEELNSIVNNSLYASEVADTANTNSENAIATANEALEQARSTGTRVTVGGEFQATFNADTKLDVDEDNKINVSKIVVGNITLQSGVEDGNAYIEFVFPEEEEEEGEDDAYFEI